MIHESVLLHEAVEGLDIRPDAIVVDATFGAGGHARAIVRELDSTGTFIGIDADKSAFAEMSQENFSPRVELVHDNFRNITNILGSLHIEEVDGILADLGWRMDQFADGERGFSFRQDGPLTMTYGNPEEYSFTAYDIVNEWDEHVIADILFGYAEERHARRIAKIIVEERAKAEIATTTQLAQIIEGAIPRRFQNKRVHPATKSFQALRIAVNDELGALEEFISAAFTALTPGGRLAIITFHSIEDRIVKHAFREFTQNDSASLISKKPIVPSEEEITNNPRARSAKLRILAKHT